MNNQSAEIDPTYAWPCSALTGPIAILFDELTRHTRLQTITFLPTSTTVAMLLVDAIMVHAGSCAFYRFKGE